MNFAANLWRILLPFGILATRCEITIARRLADNSDEPRTTASYTFTSASSYAEARGSNSTTNLVLNALAKAPPGLFASFRRLPRELWVRIYDCLEQESTSSLNLLKVSDASFQGFLDLARTDPEWARSSGSYFENDPQSVMVAGGAPITIAEPCNTISNVAYYRSMFAVCDHSNNKVSWNIGKNYIRGLVRGFNLIAFGSIYNHASRLEAGSVIDNLAISITALTAYQAILDALPDNPLLLNLKNTTRVFTGERAAEELSRILLQEAPKDWLGMSKLIDVPSYTLTFAGYAVFIVALTLPEEMGLVILNVLMEVLVRNEKDRITIRDFVIPAVKEALAMNIGQVSLSDRVKLFFRAAGMALKLANAFLWQEGIINIPILHEGYLYNSLGSALIPLFNIIANKLTGYDRSNDPSFQSSFQVYPGSAECNSRNAHSKWHELSANALVDVVFVADDVFRIVSGESLQLDELQQESELLHCFEENHCFEGFKLTDHPFDALSIQNGWAMLEKCFNATKDLAGCIVAEIYNIAELDSASHEKTTTAASLDKCLVANKCLQFREGIADVHVLQQCLRPDILSNQEASCGSYLSDKSASELIRCSTACHGNFLCISGCLRKHGSQLSSLFNVVGTCLDALLLGPEGNHDQATFKTKWNNMENQEVKEEDISPLPLTITEQLLHGFSTVTDCAVTKCRSAYQGSAAHKALLCIVASCSKENGTLFSCAQTCLASHD